MDEKVSTDQYGRKTWNVEAYAKDAKKGKSSLPSELALQAALAVKDLSALQLRAHLLDLSVLAVGTHTLISSGSTTATFGKNKRFGFACPICDLSFRDTLALVDHFNSPQHAKNASKIARSSGGGEEIEDGVRRANAQEVADMIEQLVKRLLRTKATGHDKASLQERILQRQKFEERKRQLRRAKKERKRQVFETPEETEIGKMMGFEGFGTTKQ